MTQPPTWSLPGGRSTDILVVDAGVLATALIDEVEDGSEARARLQGNILAAPALVDLEVLSVLRRLNSSGRISHGRAKLALMDLADLPLLRAGHESLLPRCWELRNNLTVYDAAYVALAERLDVPLLTADARLSRTPGVRCVIELLG